MLPSKNCEYFWPIWIGLGESSGFDLLETRIACEKVVRSRLAETMQRLSRTNSALHWTQGSSAMDLRTSQ